jgi:hypothetical protein
MSTARHHSEWLSLVEQSGPFLSMPVLMRVFPQGMEAHDPERFRLLRMAYEEWEDNNQAGRRTNPAIHGNWIKFVLRTILQLPDNCIAEGQAISQTLQVNVAEHGELLRPSIVIKNPEGGPDSGKTRLLVQTYPPGQNLSKPVYGSTWKASPDTRMMELLHGTGVRLGLVTNGEQWMLVDAPRSETTGFASWYAHLWLEEQITFRAFTTLLNANRFFAVPENETLEGMLTESASNQQEVTDQLGFQVRKAVEVLVQSLDRADQDHGHELLSAVPVTEIYEAALTVMMRLVFLFCAEERGLLLLGDAVYDENYAVSTMQEQLHETADQHGEEILERRHDAWCRLLSTFRGVFGGIDHERLTLPPYGGKLFDPDRFPFLEGRKHGTTWKNCPAEPLPVNNRTVLHLLDALQLLQVKLPGGGPAEARRLSFRALDIEQIGHVYEGLLDHTAKRAIEPMLGLAGSRNEESEVAISKLEELKAKGEDKLVEFLEEKTGRSIKALKKALAQPLDLTSANQFQAVVGNDKGLLTRIQPFAGLVRDDSFEYPVVINTGSVFVTTGTDRRSSGTHYTPKSLTEPIVQYTLEPLVYVGPAEETPKDQWKLRPAKELLDLKICDMACGSGAFLVQGCRYMADRLLEAWDKAEKELPNGTPGMTPEGVASTGQPGEMLIPKDPDERQTYARRIIAQRCLYGVDINPLAAEMAKLSLWLLTLAMNKPFTFLDHNIRCGDSLLGIHDLKQLKTFSLDGTGQQYVFGEVPMDELVDKAIQLRLKIESMPSNTVEDIETQARLMAECEQQVEFLKCAADLLVAAELRGGSSQGKIDNRIHAAVQIGHYLKDGKIGPFRVAATKEVGRRTFHWPVEFPEIVTRRQGFDAFVGNPPFLGCKYISETLGDSFFQFLLDQSGEAIGRADLVVQFFRRAFTLMRKPAYTGLIGTKSISQGDTRLVGLDFLVQGGALVYRANTMLKWPGAASVVVSTVHFSSTAAAPISILDGVEVTEINSSLEVGVSLHKVSTLSSNEPLSFIGYMPLGDGLMISEEEAESCFLKNSNNRKVIKRYITGKDFNTSPDMLGSLWIIDFQDMPLEVASAFSEPFTIVDQRVRPVRERDKRKAYRERWWQFAESRPAMRKAITQLERVLVTPIVTKYVTFAFMKPNLSFSNKFCVFSIDQWPAFSVLHSTIHLEWVVAHSTTLGSTLNYTPKYCFFTFAFPLGVLDGSCLSGEKLAGIGKAYSEHRANVMKDRHEGATQR